MADPSRTAVSIVAILAIIILVGLAVYFVIQETDETLDVDVGLVESHPATPGPGIGPDLRFLDISGELQSR